jgi:cystathionine gamma-lyase
MQYFNTKHHSLEQALAALEGGRFGVCFGSGCAAVTAAVNLLKHGDRIVSSHDVYGGTNRFLRTIAGPDWNIGTTFVDMTDLAAVRGACDDDAVKMLWLETPSNPRLDVIDIAAIAALGKARGAIVLVDNTFATPYFQRPLEHGADIVLHSATKYLGGHSDLLLGALITADPELAKRLQFIQNTTGAIPSPFDCFLTQRSIKTLAVRMEQHQRNALAVAEALVANAHVSEVNYPGLASHPQHALAKRQMTGFSGMVTFVINGTLDDVKRVCSKLRVITLAESLGGVESLINVPSFMSHGSVPQAQREALGITDTFIRLSVGIENVEDIVHDLEQALEKN